LGELLNYILPDIHPDIALNYQLVLVDWLYVLFKTWILSLNPCS